MDERHRCNKKKSETIQRITTRNDKSFQLTRHCILTTIYSSKTSNAEEFLSSGSVQMFTQAQTLHVASLWVWKIKTLYQRRVFFLCCSDNRTLCESRELQYCVNITLSHLSFCSASSIVAGQNYSCFVSFYRPYLLTSCQGDLQPNTSHLDSQNKRAADSKRGGKLGLCLENRPPFSGCR